MVDDKSPVPGSAASPAGFLLPKTSRVFLNGETAVFPGPEAVTPGGHRIILIEYRTFWNGQWLTADQLREHGAQTAVSRDE